MLVIGATSNQLNGTIHATITNLTLIEVTINSYASYLSTPVPNGACLHVAEATIEVVQPVAPAAWTCDPRYFADETCDCGCGVADPDCATSLLNVCEWCNDPGSCSAGIAWLYRSDEQRGLHALKRASSRTGDSRLDSAREGEGSSRRGRSRTSPAPTSRSRSLLGAEDLARIMAS